MTPKRTFEDMFSASSPDTKRPRLSAPSGSPHAYWAAAQAQVGQSPSLSSIQSVLKTPSPGFAMGTPRRRSLFATERCVQHMEIDSQEITMTASLDSEEERKIPSILENLHTADNLFTSFLPEAYTSTNVSASFLETSLVTDAGLGECCRQVLCRVAFTN